MLSSKPDRPENQHKAFSCNFVGYHIYFLDLTDYLWMFHSLEDISLLSYKTFTKLKIYGITSSLEICMGGSCSIPLSCHWWKLKPKLFLTFNIIFFILIFYSLHASIADAVCHRCSINKDMIISKRKKLTLRLALGSTRRPMFPLSCAVCMCARTQAMRWANTRKLGTHTNECSFKKRFLHIFHTCCSKPRWVLVKCFTEKIVCTQRL